jgi:hypothetical protein
MIVEPQWELMPLAESTLRQNLDLPVIEAELVS